MSERRTGSDISRHARHNRYKDVRKPCMFHVFLLEPRFESVSPPSSSDEDDEYVDDNDFIRYLLILKNRKRRRRSSTLFEEDESRQ